MILASGAYVLSVTDPVIAAYAWYFAVIGGLFVREALKSLEEA